MAEMRDFAREAWEAATHRHVHAQPVAEGGDTRDIIVVSTPQNPAHAHHQWQDWMLRHAADAAPETPAAVPATMAAATAAAATPQEEPMSLTTIEDDVREDLTKGLDYVTGWAQRVQTLMPAIVDTVDTVGSSTVGKLIEAAAGAVLPAPYEQVAADFVKDLVAKYGTPAAAATPAPADPAAPAQTDSAPAEQQPAAPVTA